MAKNDWSVAGETSDDWGVVSHDSLTDVPTIKDIPIADPMGTAGAEIMAAAAPRKSGDVMENVPAAPFDFRRAMETLRMVNAAREAKRDAPLDLRAAPPPIQPRGPVRAVADTGLGVYQGAAGLVKGVTDNINAGDNPVSNFLDTAIAGADRLKSDDLRQQSINRAYEIYAASRGGETAATRAAFNTLFSQPAAGADVVAKGAGSIVPTVALGAAGLGTRAMGTVNALSNAGDAASQTADTLRKLPPEMWANDPDYQTLISKGVPHDEAVALLAPVKALPAQVVGGIAGAVSGSTGAEKVLAGTAVGNNLRARAGRAGAELLGEQGETLLPQMAGNAAVGNIDGTTGITQGMGQAAVDTLAGTVPGAAIAARHGTASPEKQIADAITQAVESGQFTQSAQDIARARLDPNTVTPQAAPTIPQVKAPAGWEIAEQAPIQENPNAAAPQPAVPAADTVQPAPADVGRNDAAVPAQQPEQHQAVDTAEPVRAPAQGAAPVTTESQPNGAIPTQAVQAVQNGPGLVDSNTSAVPAPDTGAGQSGTKPDLNQQAAAQPQPAVMNADVEKPIQQPNVLSDKAMQITQPTEGLRPGDIVAASGKPFATKAQATTEARKAGTGWQVKKGAGGFVVRYQPQTAAQIAATARLTRAANQVDTHRDSLFGAIAKSGGLSIDAATKEWGFDPAEFKNLRVGVKPVVRKTGGMSLDAMAERLAEMGYLSRDEHGKHDMSEFFDLFDGELRGNKHFTPQGFDNQAEAHRAAEYDNWVSQEQKDRLDALPDDGHQAIEDFLDANPQTEAELEHQLEREGIDYDSSTSLAGENGQVAHDGGAEKGNHAVAGRPAGETAAAPDTGQRAPDFALSSETVAQAQARTEQEAQQRAEQERKNAEQDQRAQADAQRDSFTLTGSDRSADTQAAQGQKSIFDDNGNGSPDSGNTNETRQHRDQYTQDLFGTALPAAVRNDTNAQPGQAAGVPVNVDTADAVPGQGTFASQTKLVTETTRTLGATKATTPEQVATAMSYLGRSAVERFDALVTDKDGNPLAIVGAFKGSITQSPVYPATLVGEAFRIKDAAHIWFAHNHPSGRPDLSQADRTLTDMLLEAFRGSDIEAHGTFAIAGSETNQRPWMFTDGKEDLTGTTGEPTATMPISVVEREYSATGKLGRAISSPQQAKIEAKNLAAGQSGILLFDAQMQPVGFVPVDVAMPLRAEGRMDAIYRAISMANASTAMIVNQGKFNDQEARNIAGLLNSIDVRVVDVMDIKPSGVESMAEKGMDFSSKTFFSKAADVTGTQAIGKKVFDLDLGAAVGQGKSVDALLFMIENRSANPQFRELANTLRTLKLKTTFELGTTQGRKFEVKSVGEHNVRASYNSAADRAVLYRMAGAEAAILHELVHAATVKAIDANTPAGAALRELYKRVQSHGDWSSHYGMENVKEFIAEALTNPRFQEALRNTMIAPDANVSFWQKLVALIRAVLGKSVPASALDEVMRLAPDLFAEDQTIGQNAHAPAAASMVASPDTIEVDGVERSRTNSDGQVINYLGKNLENFWHWYGDGPVDDQGRPIVTDRHYINADGQRKAIDNVGTWDAKQGSVLYSRADDTVNGMKVDRSQDDLNFGPRTAFNVPDPGVRDNIIRALQNNKIDLKRVQEAIKQTGSTITEGQDAYLNEELYIGKVTDLLDKFAVRRVTPMLEAINKAGLTLDEVNTYLYARHAPERNAQLKKINPNRINNDRLSGMSDNQARKIMADFREVGKDAKLAPIAAMVDNITKESRRRLVAQGLETADVVAAWESVYKNYVPLMADMDVGPKRGKGGYNVKGPESQRALGQLEQSQNILANVIAQAQSGIMRSEKAKVGRSLLDLARQFPNDQFWKVDEPPKKRRINPDTGLAEWAEDPLFKAKDNVLVVKENGKEHFIVFNETNERAMQLAAAMQNLDAAQLPWVIEATGKFTRHLAQWITARNPLFWMTNFARDVQHAAFNLADTPISGKEATVLKNIPMAMQGYWKITRGDGTGQWADYAKEFKAAGAETGFVKVFDNPSDHMKDLQKQFDQMQQGTADPRKLARTMVEAIDDYNNIIENGVRLAVYQTARKNGVSIRRAASMAKNITVNFNRRGNQTTFFNALYMFMNANIQGHARFLTVLATSKKAQAVAGALVGMGFMLDIVGRAFGGDDDQTKRKKYDEIPDFEKEKNWIFMYPDGSGRYIKIPMPQGPHLMVNMGRMISESLFSSKKTSAIERALQLARVTVDSFNPLGAAGSFSQLITPTIAKPIVQIESNKTFTGAPMYREGDDRHHVGPAYTRHFRSTAEHWIEASKLLSDITGGDKIKPGKIDIPPEVLRTLLTSYIAPGVTQAADKAVDTATRSAQGKKVEASQVPGLSRFYGEAPEQRAQERAYYEEQKRVKQSLEQVRKYAKAGDRAGMERTLAELGDGDAKKGRQIKAEFDAAEKGLADLNKRRALLENDKIPDHLQKRQLDQIEERRIALMRRILN